MGKMGVLIVLGLVVAFAFIGYTVNRSNVKSVENTSSYYKYTTARNIAHSAVNIALHQLENGYVNSFSGAVMGGTYQVGIAFAADSATLDLTSSGRYVDTSYTMVLKLKRYAKPFPNVQAAVGLAVDSVGFEMHGSTVIDGRNHDMNGNLQSDTSNKAGVYVMTSYDSSRVAGYSSFITGSPKVKVNPNMSNPLDYVDEYIANADYFYSSGTYGGSGTWGSATSPVIVYADAGTGQVKFTGTIEGWGILVVKGKLTFSGTFKFHGLVLAYQDSELNDEITIDTGTPRVIGGIIMTGGSGSTFVMKGNGTFAYSKAALDKAQNMNKLLAYSVLKWYE
jgi:hypothetical protein